MFIKKTIGFLIALIPLTALAVESHDSCKTVKMVPERLPDLNIPRFSNLAVFCQNGELTIFGGHTTGFVLTPTAEYYRDGKWHQIPMTYNHDYGLCVRLSSGKMLLGGGATQNLGIGQSFETEVYDPMAHSFSRYGCLDRKRFHSEGLELDSGRVVIAGNWYTKDGIELYDTLSNTFTFVKEVAQQRSHVYILRTAKDNVIILSSVSEYADTIFSPIVDRLKGEPFTVPLFETWTPLYPHCDFFSDDSFIGDEAQGEYAYLMPLMNREGQVAIAQVRDTVFSLLPTVCPIPTESSWGRIQWFGSILVDRQAQRGYLIGSDADCRQFFLTIDYAANPAKLTIYYTDPMPDAGCIHPVISPDGDLYVIGGLNAKHNNFTPLGSVLLYRFGSQAGPAAASSNVPWLGIIMAVLAVLGLIIFLTLQSRKVKRLPQAQPQAEDTDGSYAELMGRIEELMEQEKPYLNSELKMSDVAAVLGIHQNDISSCINSMKGCSFSQFINTYRVEYAKQLLSEQTDMKILTVYTKSGFANEQSFYRTFKQISGMTPREWKDAFQEQN